MRKLSFLWGLTPDFEAKTEAAKRINPRRGGWGCIRLFLAVKIFYFTPP